MHYNPTTGKLLKDARIKKDLSLVDIAKTLGVSIQMVCDVESGRKSLPDKYIDAWASAVGEDPDLVAIDLWQRRLNDFNRNRNSKRKLFFKIVPVLDEFEDGQGESR